MKTFRFLVLLSNLLLLTACEYHGYSYRFSNNSTVDVYMYFEYGVDFLYPDTAISNTSKCYFLKQGKRFTYFYGYEYVFDRKDTISMFIFDSDTFNMYSWEEIRNGYKILQRYDLSDEDFKALRHSISYPPTEAMKDVKMYPPYEQ